MNRSWRPLLSGPEAAQALSVVEEIAAATSRATPTRPGGISPEDFPVWQSSLDGRAGQSLLQAYLFLHGAGEAYSDAAIALLDEAMDAAATLPMRPSLYYGFPGIAWVAAHLTGRLFVEEEDSGSAVDELLLETLTAGAPWQGRYDLFEGLVGLGTYALERRSRPSAVRLLEAVVTQLAARAEQTAAGAAFFSPAATLYPAYRKRFPQGAYNLGMAHGLAGVIAFLGSLCHAGVATSQARPLLDAAVAWLLAREEPAERDFRFGHFHVPGATPERCRLAWCYGDLGVATALLVAGRGAGQPTWESIARRVAGVAAARLPGEAEIHDAGLCHGAAGAGHLFNRLFQATGDAHLEQAARFWLGRSLALREPVGGVAGYRAVDRGERFDDPGFRLGASGTGLALLAAASAVPPEWDRLLLASLATAPAPPAASA